MTTTKTTKLELKRPGTLTLSIQRHDFGNGRRSMTAWLAGDDARFIAYAHSSDHYVDRGMGQWANLWIGTASFDLSDDEFEIVRAFICADKVINAEVVA